MTERPTCNRPSPPCVVLLYNMDYDSEVTLEQQYLLVSVVMTVDMTECVSVVPCTRQVDEVGQVGTLSHELEYHRLVVSSLLDCAGSGCQIGALHRTH